MIRNAAGTTNPTLLNRLCDWRDREAWFDFVTRYDPMIRSVSRRYRLDPDTMEELCQRVWIDLARRMRSFRYDPEMTLRGWLRRLCQSQAIDLLRKQKADAAQTLEFRLAGSLFQDPAERVDAEEGTAAERPSGNLSVKLRQPRVSLTTPRSGCRNPGQFLPSPAVHRGLPHRGRPSG
jgi:RNA polymerase sigma factor (sigma-70 family)